MRGPVYVSWVVKYNKKSFHHLTTFFMSTWWWICIKLKSHDGFLSYLQDRTANLTAIFCFHWSALKKPSWELNFFHIFAVPLSSRDEKCFQMLEILFVVFQHSRNIVCKVTSKTSQILSTIRAVLSAMFGPNISDSFDLSLHWASIVRDLTNEFTVWWARFK